MNKKRVLILLISFVTLFIIALTGCIVTGSVEIKVYGEGFVANIDSFSGSSKPHRVLFKNNSGEKITVKYSITESNDSSGYDKTSEPNWTTVTQNITVNADATGDIVTNLGSSSNNYACVWMRVQDQENKKYVIFSVFLSKADNMEYDVTIKSGNK